MCIEQRQNETGFVRQSTDPAGRLDILSGGLRLALHHHETEATDIEANGNHVGRERDVHAVAASRLAEGSTGLYL